MVVRFGAEIWAGWSDFGQAGKILDRNLGDFGQNFGQVDQIWAIWTTL